MKAKRKMLSDDVIIRPLYALPYTVKAYVAPSPDGYKNVYYNPNVPKDQVIDAMDHEDIHVAEDHWQYRCVEEIEEKTRERTK